VPAHCVCQNPSSWLTLKECTDDIITFSEEGKKVSIDMPETDVIMKMDSFTS